MIHEKTKSFREGIAVSATLVLFALATSSYALAEPDQKNKVSGQEVAAMYYGKTWTWSKGASYWGRDASFQATWEESVGIGKWYATTQGNLCYEALWKDAANSPGTQIKRCWMHVRDSKGSLWKQDSRTNEWYPAANEMNERIKDGNGIQSSVSALRNKVGL